jgi:exopolyphosphatase/guanosine-5'-triphosphate,3'-diphosphate pyrophosphatase
VRLAAIDIGSNSVRSIIVDAPAGERFRVLDDEREQTRLGRGLATTGSLEPDAMDETVHTVERMVEIARSFNCETVRIVATAAVRAALNGPEFSDRIAEATGIPVDVISDEEEARLAWVSAAANFDLSGRAAVFDIGGGSLEIARASDGAIEWLTSLPLGVVVMTEKYRAADLVDDTDFKQMRRLVRRNLGQAFGPRPDPATVVVGSGGSVNAIAAMLSRGERVGPSLQGFEIRRADLVHLLAELRRMNAEQRSRVPGMPPHRVDVIVAGTLVVSELMRVLGANVCRVNQKGLREGIVIDTLAKLGDGGHASLDRATAVEAFARRCGYERPHAERVRDLALSLFDQLGEVLGLAPDTRPLLDAAGILHDVGYHIAYEKHHKHSHHLIVHADIPGFSQRELALVAAIARYHTGGMPKRKHTALAQLSAQDIDTALDLAALLRMADGMDRTRSQRVSSVEACVTPRGTAITLHGAGDLTVELFGTRRKSDLFAQRFLMPVEITSGPPEADG